MVWLLDYPIANWVTNKQLVQSEINKGFPETSETPKTGPGKFMFNTVILYIITL